MEYVIDDFCLNGRNGYETLFARARRLVEADMLKRRLTRCAVLCDWRNNTEEELEQGRVYVEIHCPMTRRVEKVVVNVSAF